jgi:hypothetical protein
MISAFTPNLLEESLDILDGVVLIPSSLHALIDDDVVEFFVRSKSRKHVIAGFLNDGDDAQSGLHGGAVNAVLDHGRMQVLQELAPAGAAGKLTHR